MKALDTFTCQGSLSGDVVEMTVDAVMLSFQVIRRDLPCHIDGNPALQSQHHFLERTVNAVDDIEMKPFFERHGNGKHPFFPEFQILSHIFHGHVTAHEYRFHGFGKDGSLEKVQFPLLHGLNAIVGFGGGKLKGHRRNLQLIKMDGANIFIQIEGVQMLQKAFHGIVGRGRAAAQPVSQRRKKAAFRGEFFLWTADEFCQDSLFICAGFPACHIAAEPFDKAVPIRKAALAQSDTRQIRGIKTQKSGKVRVTDIQRF